MVAAKVGGADVSGNPRLRTAVDKAKAENLPADNIERAVKKGAGELAGVVYEDGLYEGYGPGGVAILVEYTTDNKNRTAAEVRHAFTHSGGSLGSSGSVAYLFDKRGVFTFEMAAVSEERIMESALEAGAEDVVTNIDENIYEVYSAPQDFFKVKTAFDQADIKCASADISMMPKTSVNVEGKTARQVLNLLETLEDLDDVLNVYSNFEMSDSEMAEMV